ncbi:MAG: hypothetical protein HY228_00715 [Candidatus Yonathbacteria bacterium]|nr:hypothetical protein [Candidatus Yonathbacteria bacterium]
MRKKTKNIVKRPSWDELFMMTAILVATRHSCLKRGVGSCIVKDNKIVATGYNGAAKGIKSCLELGYCYYEHLAEQEVRTNGGDIKMIKESFKMYCQAVHAEANAKSQCLPMVAEGSTIYITNVPCPKCTQDIIITGGVKAIVVWKEYLQNYTLTTDEKKVTDKKLQQAGIALRFLDLTSHRIMEIAGYMANRVGERLDYQFKGGG